MEGDRENIVNETEVKITKERAISSVGCLAALVVSMYNMSENERFQPMVILANHYAAHLLKFIKQQGGPDA